jgi:hypothetical protein
MRAYRCIQASTPPLRDRRNPFKSSFSCDESSYEVVIMVQVVTKIRSVKEKSVEEGNRPRWRAPYG